MSTSTEPRTAPKPKVFYPETDGKPMAENTVQFRYIVMIEGGFEALFLNDPNVFVAGDLFWYPVEGENTIVQAPDALVALGRPKGDRRSYRQWEEGNIAPQVVFEVLSPSNTSSEMQRKFEFYERYGVQEYYIYDPDNGTLEGWQRSGGKLKQISTMQGWVSPLLKVRFELKDGELCLFRPDGRQFGTYAEVVKQEELARAEVEKARRAVSREKRRAEQEKQRAEQEKQRAEQEKQRADRLAALLRESGIDPGQID